MESTASEKIEDGREKQIGKEKETVVMYPDDELEDLTTMTPLHQRFAHHLCKKFKR